MTADLLQAFQAVFELQTLGFLAVGVVLGAIFGALPGLTATMGVAVLTPLTFWVSAEQGLAMLLGIYAGAIPAGGIPAILINVPGTPASIATAWDGYPLAQQGKAGQALGLNALMSLLGQLVSILFLAVAAFPIAQFALSFGPAEYFGLALFGISLMAGVSGKHVIKGLLAGTLGLGLATVGLDPMTAFPRFNFGVADFLDGISFVPVMIGLFGLSEVLTQAAQRGDRSLDAPGGAALGRTLPTMAEAKQVAPSAFAGAAIGTLVGAIPAAGGDVGSVIAWEQTRRLAKDKESYGKGSIEGLSSAVSAANAAIGGAMTTMLTLGIPGDAVSAILIGALLIHGIQPGPLLFQNDRPFVFTLVLLMVLAAVLMSLLGLLGAKPLARVLRVPNPWLWAGIILFGTVGAYALNNAVVDVWAMYAAGVIGFLLRRANVPLGPLVLGLILGPMMEANLRRALVLSRGDWLEPLSRPIVLFFLIATVVSLASPFFRKKEAST